MHRFKVDFDSLDWLPLAPGLRSKSHGDGLRQIRLLELSCDFVEPDWCDNAHVGMILSGTLEIDFRDQSPVRYPEGSGIFILPGASHKARSITPLTRLVLVENIQGQVAAAKP